jgi:hypothetical protein
MNTLEVLRGGIVSVLDLWRERFGGAEDALYWVLRVELADPSGADGRRQVLRQVPAALADQVARSFQQIDAYFDNVRYVLLDPTTRVWGTLTNALRVVAGVETVTEKQRVTFTFDAESAARFFRAAHSDANLADRLTSAFKPMPAADCQTLAALFNPNLEVTIDAPTVLAIVRLLGNEGPLTHEESTAFATLRDTGLVNAAFRGTREQG